MKLYSLGSLRLAFAAVLCSTFLTLPSEVLGQEVVGPLLRSPAAPSASTGAALHTAKTTALTLPFFDDFIGYSPLPSADRWLDREALVNNSFAFGQPSRGVATLDGLGANGRPYDTVNALASRYADSLTSADIDLTTYTPGDSLYLSFLWQPGGTGFYPEAGDSLEVYFRDKSGGWRRQWGMPGSTATGFHTAMVPLRDTIFFGNEFRFRFVNRASLNVNDDVWNIDYVYLNDGRTAGDSSIDDIAATLQPTPFLADYAAMPLRHYLTNLTGLQAPTHAWAVRNNTGTAATVTGRYEASDALSGTSLGGGAPQSIALPAATETTQTFTTTIGAAPVPDGAGRAVLRERFYINATGNGPAANDTIERVTEFSNYLAYDDGTAERSYFLKLAPTLPGRVAIEHLLQVPDTIRGVAVLFGQQVPTAAGKFFTASVYSAIAGIGGAGADAEVYREDLLQPRFTDSINHFAVYAFRTPVVMPAGLFYIGLTQPALSGSDSLYYALDMDRVGGNHLYYNVEELWLPSTITGALMVRPLLGGALPQGVDELAVEAETLFTLAPNPGAGLFRVIVKSPDARSVRMTDLAGRVVLEQPMARGDLQIVDVRRVPPGMYLVQVRTAEGWSRAQRWVKQ